MKIATHNVEFLFGEGTHSHSDKEWIYTPDFVQSRVDHFAQLFSQIDADVLLLQEVASEDVIKRIIAKSGIDYSYFLATPTDGVGNAVLYKDKAAICTSIPARTSLPVFNKGDADILGSRIWSRRDFVQIQTTYKGKSLSILGVHIKSNFLIRQNHAEGKEFPIQTQLDSADGLIRSEIFRFSQAKKIREVVDGFFREDPEAQVIVTGDFNAREENSVFRIIRGDLKKLPDSLVSVTRNIPESKRYSSLNKGKGFLIDHMLVSKSLEGLVLDTQILNETLGEHENTPDSLTFPGSDHAPIVIELAGE